MLKRAKTAHRTRRVKTGHERASDAAQLRGDGGNVVLVMIIATLARALSLFANIRYTAHFGYTLETDIYSYAVNLPNIIFTSIGTALTTVVIPIFAGRLAAGERDKANGFVNRAISLSSLIAAAIAFVGILSSPLIVRIVDNFNNGDPALALFALRLMFPVIVFHAVQYVLAGVLQSNGSFTMPAAASAFSGISIILYVTFFAGSFGIRGLLAATFIGLALQCLCLIPSTLRKTDYRFRPSFDISDGDIRHAGRLALPVLVSSSSYQLNMFINSTFAAGFDGGVVTITNMQTLAFTAAQLFILSMLTVYFPRMSSCYATGDTAGFRAAYSSVLRLTIIFALPASAGLALLSRYLIPLIYGYGRVTESDLALSSAVFAVYALSIVVIGFKETADRAFYAAHDSKTPALAGILIMCTNIALSFVLKHFLGLVGLPLAYLIAMIIGTLTLTLILSRRDNAAAAATTAAATAPVSVIPAIALRCILSTVVMSVLILASDAALSAANIASDSSIVTRAVRFALLTAVGAVSYLVSAGLFGVPGYIKTG